MRLHGWWHENVRKECHCGMYVHILCGTLILYAWKRPIVPIPIQISSMMSTSMHGSAQYQFRLAVSVILGVPNGTNTHSGELTRSASETHRSSSNSPSWPSRVLAQSTAL